MSVMIITPHAFLQSISFWRRIIITITIQEDLMMAVRTDDLTLRAASDP